MALDAGGTAWTYDVAFSFTGADTYDHAVNISMQHAAGASSFEYEGLITYQVDDVWGNTGNCGATDRTYNGTVYYNRTSETAMQLNAREGMYCGLGVTGAKAADSAVTGGGSDITYAPRNTCTYGTSDTAGFVYDRNLDNSLTDETAATAQVDVSGTTLALDLMDTTGVTDMNSDSVINIEDKMLSRGWVQPPL